jgi:hypothetical protein
MRERIALESAARDLLVSTGVSHVGDDVLAIRNFLARANPEPDLFEKFVSA